MSEFCCFLDQYPLREHYRSCGKYLEHQIDWASKSAEIVEKGVVWFDVSDAIEIFPHLVLNKNYSLICSLSSEYHGLWGRVAALHQDASKNPTVDSDNLWSKLTHGTHFKLPEEAAPPMEAIYNDGTPEGYFEALLCDLFLSALPYARYEQEQWEIIMTEPPALLDSVWETYIDILDWRPRLVDSGHRLDTLLVFQRKIENGIGSSSGRDRIYLSQYNFQDRLGLYHALERKHNRTMYHGRINDARYTDQRHCCVSVASSILVACEKCDTVKWKTDLS